MGVVQLGPLHGIRIFLQSVHFPQLDQWGVFHYANSNLVPAPYIISNASKSSDESDLSSSDLKRINQTGFRGKSAPFRFHLPQSRSQPPNPVVVGILLVRTLTKTRLPRTIQCNPNICVYNAVQITFAFISDLACIIYGMLQVQDTPKETTWPVFTISRLPNIQLFELSRSQTIQLICVFIRLK